MATTPFVVGQSLVGGNDVLGGGQVGGWSRVDGEIVVGRVGASLTRSEVPARGSVHRSRTVTTVVRQPSIPPHLVEITRGRR